MTVKLYRDIAKPTEIPYELWSFPGGEVGVKLDSKKITLDRHYKISVEGIPSSKDIFVALNLCDAVFNIVQDKFKVVLNLAYFPYARQDRVCNSGESFALKVFVNMLVAQESFGYLEVDDLHSHVTKQLFRGKAKFVITENSQLLNTYLLKRKYNYIVYPDDGAAKKAHVEVTNSVILSKVRREGKVEYEDYLTPLEGKVLVVDDICDGGATFLSLAEMLKKNQPGITQLDLYVTHGIFSKGVDSLFKFYHNIYCRNLMNQSVVGVKEI